jgi:hypothetical protein
MQWLLAMQYLPKINLNNFIRIFLSTSFYFYLKRNHIPIYFWNNFDFDDFQLIDHFNFSK